MDSYARACIVSDVSIETDVEAWLLETGCLVETSLQGGNGAQTARILRLPERLPDFPALPERQFRYICCSAQGSHLVGGLSDNDFAADLLVTVGIAINKTIEPNFSVYLNNNIFGAFKTECIRVEADDRLLFHTTLPLNSTAYRDVRHELPTYALRSGSHVLRESYVEIFSEDGNVLSFGELARADQSLSSACITVRNPATRLRGVCGFGQPLKWA